MKEPKKLANISLLGNIHLNEVLYAKFTEGKAFVLFNISIMCNQEYYKNAGDEFSVGNLGCHLNMG